MATSRTKRKKTTARGRAAGRGARRTGVRLGDVRLRPIPDPIDWDEALRLHDEGWSAAEIARRFGYRRSTIHMGLRRRGAKAHRRWKRVDAPLGLKLYSLWHSLRARCENPKEQAYANFGAQGIRFATEWQDFDTFYDWAMRSGYEPGLRLLRKNAEGDFEPRNCRWVPASVAQARRRYHREPPYLVRAFGVRKGPMEWSRDPRCKVPRRTLLQRLHAGWPPEEAISLPAGSRPSRRVAPPKSRLPPSKPPARIDWSEARRLYEDEKLSVNAIARRFAATRGTVAVGLKRLGVERRPRQALTRSDRETRRLYQFWCDVRRRCEDPKHHRYGAYGARGIRVARAWREFEPFLEWARATGSRKGLHLARRDQRKGFSAANCFWKSPKGVRPPTGKETKRSPVRLITAFGETKGLEEWSRDPRCLVSSTAVRFRLERGLTTEEAISLPPARRGDHPTTQIAAFGTAKSLSDWERDRRCKIGRGGIRQRLRSGWSAEDALSTPRYEHPKKRAKRAGRRG